MVSDKLKSLIYHYLNKELNGVEVIVFKKNIWFINREKRFWYFELREDGVLLWRWSFFTEFFSFFSLSSEKFEPILISWVESTLNKKVNETLIPLFESTPEVREVLWNLPNIEPKGSWMGGAIVNEILNLPMSEINSINLTEQ